MKTCFVTGGAGFIGSHLVKELLKNYRVIVVDNVSSGSENNIKQFKDNKNFMFVKHDIKESIKIDEHADYIFHLASRASPVDFAKYPVDILLTNSMGTYNMLVLAKEHNARFLLASTSEVYGDPLQHPQKEEYWGNVNPHGVRSCYDESKRFGESMAMAFHRMYKLDVRIARIFNTYGPLMRADDGRVIPTFIAQAIRNKPITIHGSGKQIRSFCYVSDMAEGLIRLMFIKNLNGDVFNLGNEEESSILDIANIIKNMTGSKSRILFTPRPANDPERRKPDISKAKRLLEWEPKVILEDGLKETIEYFKNNI